MFLQLVSVSPKWPKNTVLALLKLLHMLTGVFTYETSCQDCVGVKGPSRQISTVTTPSRLQTRRLMREHN